MDALFARFFPGQEDAEYGYHRALRAHLGGRQRILNFGCGRNADLAVFGAEGHEVWGADFAAHPELADPAYFRPLAADGTAPFPDASFDLVAARWVLEHVTRPGPFLGEVGRLLRPGGRFVALTVNGGHYISWFSRAADWLAPHLKQRLVLRLYGRSAGDTFPAFYRLNTPVDLRRWAAAAELDVEGITGYANADYFRFAPLLRRGAVVTDWLLERARPGLGQAYLVVTLCKPAAAVASRRPRDHRLGAACCASGSRTGGGA
jgi:SAM-dependent methyltransferase